MWLSVVYTCMLLFKNGMDHCKNYIFNRKQTQAKVYWLIYYLKNWNSRNNTFQLRQHKNRVVASTSILNIFVRQLLDQLDKRCSSEKKKFWIQAFKAV